MSEDLKIPPMPYPEVTGVTYPSKIAEALFANAAWGEQGWSEVQALRAKLEASETLINDLLEAVVPYRENTDGTTSSTIPDHIIDRINAMFPRKP